MGNIKKISGQMFVEILVGIGVIMVALVGVVALTSQSEKIGRITGNRSEAMELAQRNMERLRNLRDENVNSFFSRTNGVCPVTNSPTYSCMVTYGHHETSIDITIDVSWQEAGQDMNYSVKTIFARRSG